MKIAVLTSGILPVPAVQGGAVEVFLDYFLDYNNRHHLHDITVYSVYHPDVEKCSSLSSEINHYHFIDVTSFLAKVRKHIWGLRHRDTHHHFSIEYFLDRSLQHIQSCNYDLIILNNRPGYAEVLTEKTKAKIVYNLYNDKLNYQTRNHQAIYDAASLIISTSNYITSRVQTIGDYANKCVTVYSGIDLSIFAHAAEIDRASMGFHDNDFILVFSGRLVPEKGIMELIEAMILLKNETRIKLLVMGSSFFGNSQKDDAFISELKHRAKELDGRIIFTGYVKHEQMPGYLKMANVAVIPSTWNDPFPTTVLEGMAAGLPIITTDRGGIPEMVTPDNALVLPFPGDLTGNLAHAIQYLYNNKELCQQMRTASLVLSKQYSKENYARDFFKAIDTL